MTRSAIKTRTLVAALGALTAVAACAGKEDVDRTQPDKLEKAIFFNEDGSPKKFYYRWTVTDIPPTSGWAFEGIQGSMDKITFKITEDSLIGYRAYDYAPGTQNDITGGVNNTDAPIVSFKIKSHFDVKREYNAGTGEETNVISEDTRDRDWSARQFMRVDWSTDKLANPLVDVTLAPPPSEYGLPTPTNVGNASISEVEITNPGRAIYTKDYVDITVQAQATPDYEACMKLAAPDDGGPWSCGPSKISLRHSFVAVKESEYEPLDYPDRQPLLDAAGKPISVFWDNRGPHSCSSDTLSKTGGTYSGADCAQVGADQFSKFGFFRTVRQVYNRRLGATEVERKYLANRWNIWDKTIQRDAQDGTPLVDAAGNQVRIRPENRAPRQIPYYLNVEFPDNDPLLMEAAKQIVGEWNGAMKRTVAALRATAVRDGVPEAAIITAANAQAADGTPNIPDIFVLKQNTCNLAGVNQYLADHPDMLNELRAKTASVTPAIDPANLTRAILVPVCTALEALTQTLPETDAKKFSWQRNGDLRYSFVYWVDRPQGALFSPLGYGPSSADPETGEIVSATLYMYGAALDVYAQFAADSVDTLNGKLSTDDLLSGKRFSDVLKETAVNRQQRDAFVLTPEARDYAHALAATGGLPGVRPAATNPTGGATTGSTSASRLVKVDPFAVDSKFAAIKGTPLETQMMTQDILVAFVPGYIPGRTNFADVKPDLLAKASPVKWLSESSRQARRDRFQKLSMNGCVFTADFADDAILGTAISLANLSGDALFKTLRAKIFRGLGDHEMGHTMGLRHNFAGSTDALNYGKKYWDIRTNVPKEKWAENGLGEHQYSTVMDYGARFNTDNEGLGRYDYAAIRFAYGQLIDLMGEGSANAANSLSYDIFFGDYKKIPNMLSADPNVPVSPAVVDEVNVMRYATAVDNLQQGYRDLATNMGAFGIHPERPYKFCSDEFEGNLDCKVWDMGADQKEIINNVIDLYKNYYVFNAYKRGRLTWSIDGYLSRLTGRYFNRFSEAFQFYYFFGDAFYGTYLADDLLGAAIQSLNSLGEVLQTPEPGLHCATDTSPDVLVVSSGFGPVGTCRNDAPQMTIALPDGKPYYIDFSDDYYYRVTRAGSLYEKLAALIALTSTQSRFFRVDSFADQDRYSINYYRLFKDQMLNLLSGVIRDDPTSYGGYVSGGIYKPAPVVDPAIFGKATYPTPEYMLPTARRVATPVNKTIRFYALGLALAQLNSTWDSTLDFSNYVNVTLKGGNDDVTYAPGTTVVEFADPISHLVYRAAQVDPAHPGIGVTVLQELNQIAGVPGTPGTLAKKYGTSGGKPLADWNTARANVDAAKTAAALNTDTTKTAALQTTYTEALQIFNFVDYLLNFRVDLLGDIRTFRQAFAY